MMMQLNRSLFSLSLVVLAACGTAQDMRLEPPREKSSALQTYLNINDFRSGDDFMVYLDGLRVADYLDWTAHFNDALLPKTLPSIQFERREPDIVFQIRNAKADGLTLGSFSCLGTTGAPSEMTVAVANIDKTFKNAFGPTAFARGYCDSAGARPHTTIGVWTSGSPFVQIEESLKDYDILDRAAASAGLATFVSARFMRAEVRKATEQAFSLVSDYQLVTTDVIIEKAYDPDGSGPLNVVPAKVNTHLEFKRTGSNLVRKANFRERLSTVPASETTYGACEAPKPAFSVTTEREYLNPWDNDPSLLIVMNALHQQFKDEKGVLFGLNQRGMFPSRLASPKDLTNGTGAFHLDYGDQLGDILAGGKTVEYVHEAGIMQGIITEVLPLPLVGAHPLTGQPTHYREERRPCAIIRGPYSDGTYRAELFDLREPTSYSWTGSGVTPLSPLLSKTKITLDPNVMSEFRMLNVSIQDTDGYYATDYKTP